MAESRVHLFYGPDEFSAREAVRALRHQLGVADTNVVRLDGGTAPIQEMIAASHTATFFAEPRLVIIEGLARRLGGRRRSRAKASENRRQQAAASDFDQLMDSLSDIPDSTTVVLLEPDAPPGFVETFKGVAAIRFFPVKRGEEVRRWAEARLKERGASISAMALERLTQTIDGYHLGELAQEIEKLIVYADGRRIEAQDIEEVGASAVQHQTWDLTDAVIAGRADHALRVLQRMDEKQHPPQLLLSMLVRQYRQVLLAQTLLKEGLAASQIGERLGIAHQFPLAKVIDQASRYPAGQLEQAYRRLLDADVAVKTGVMDVETALEALIVDLSQIGNAGRRRLAGDGFTPAGRRF